MEEIKTIVEKYDLAAHVVLHTPGNCEYLMKISPSYSCATQEGDMIRFKAKAADFNGDKAARDKKIADTANMMRSMADVMGQNTLAFLKVAEQFDQYVDAEHGKGGFSSHTTQNN